MLTTGAVSNENFATSSSPNQFPLMNDSAFSASTEAKPPIQAGRQLSQSRGLVKSDPLLEGIISDQLSSSANPLLSNQFSALFPSTVSLTPPSPDSGVVADSKLDLGHDLLQNHEDDRLKLSPNSMKLSNLESGNVSEAIASGFSAGNMLHLKDSSTDISKMQPSNVNSLGLSPSKMSVNSCVPISQDLATIWSPPTVPEKNPGFDAGLQTAMLQALQHQKSIDNWSEVGTPAKPPPGLGNIPLLQKRAETQQSGSPLLNGLRQNLPLRRSQSVMLNRSNMFASASLLPGMVVMFEIYLAMQFCYH